MQPARRGTRFLEPLPTTTNMLFGQYGNNDWPAILSVLIMAMLPAIVFYLILQKNILKGISEGALKQ